MARGFLAAFGILVVLIGATWITYAVAMLASGGDDQTPLSVHAGLLVFFGGLSAAGAFLAWRMLRPPPVAAGMIRPGVEQAGPAQRGRSGRGGRGDGQPGSGPPANEAERERRVLRLAEQEHGRVTVPEVAARCTMTIDEAKAELDRLVLQRVAELQVTSSGVLVYVFRGFLSDEDKAGATDF